METINPGVFFTGMAAVALLGFAGTVGRRYTDELSREALETATAPAAAPATARVTPAATAGRPSLRLIHGGRTDAPRQVEGDRQAKTLPRAA